MLSGEGKEKGENTAIGLISKKATLHVLSHRRYKIVMLFFQKKCILCFLSLALALCRSQFSR